MSRTIVESVRRCRDCGETKSLGEFYFTGSRDANGIRRWRRRVCKTCDRKRLAVRQARQRDRMGEAAFRAHRADATRRHRAKTGDTRNKAVKKARLTALYELAALHPSQFEAIFNRIKYEQGLM